VGGPATIDRGTAISKEQRYRFPRYALINLERRASYYPKQSIGRQLQISEGIRKLTRSHRSRYALCNLSYVR
jgi:hypothetical protein